MSNPGVIELYSYRCDRLKRIYNSIIGNETVNIAIEDNIGESIHIHFNEMRVDLTIAEFRKLALQCRPIVNSYLENIDEKLVSLSTDFLVNSAKHIPHISKVDEDDVGLDDLKCIFYKNFDNKIIEIRPLSNSPMVKYLKGDREEYLSYQQCGRSFFENEPKLDNIVSSLSQNGYPYMGKFIVLFGDQNIIRDGLHRASSLFAKNKDKLIPIQRFYFSKGFNSWKINFVRSRNLYRYFRLISMYIYSFARLSKNFISQFLK